MPYNDSRTKPPQTIPPRTKPPRTHLPLHPHKTPYKTPQTQTTTAKITQNKPQIPNKAPQGQNLAKSKMAFILNSDDFRALLLMLNGKLYVYIQLQMRYLIASGST